EKDGSKSKNTVNHFSFGDEVHKVAGDEGRFADRDNESYRDVNFAAPEVNIRSADGNGGAEEQRVEDEKIAADMMAEMLGVHRCRAVAGIHRGGLRMCV